MSHTIKVRVATREWSAIYNSDFSGPVIIMSGAVTTQSADGTPLEIPGALIKAIVEREIEAFWQAAAGVPKWEHNCPHCQFLAQVGTFDLYFCRQHGVRPTVLARYGSEGPQYESGLELAEHIPALARARDIAVARGLLP